MPRSTPYVPRLPRPDSPAGGSRRRRSVAGDPARRPPPAGGRGRGAPGPAPAGRHPSRAGRADPAGNRTIRDASLVVDRTAGNLAWSPSLFYPQDGDAYAATARLSFKLTRTATTTLRIYNSAGAS